MTVGLLGGSFDPPHNGHVVLVHEAIRRFELERLLVVVTGIAPHKAAETPPDLRYCLADAAFGALPGIELSRHEIDRAVPSYTVNTVQWARERWGDIVFFVGADEFAGFLSWRDPNGVLEQARLGVATRPGYPRTRLEEVLAALRQPERVELFDIPALPISSTAIRELVARGQAIDDLVPPGVAELIADLGLYRGS